MSFIADQHNNFELWDYIIGDHLKDMSLMVDRFKYLNDLDTHNDDFKIAFRDIKNNTWSRWDKFPGLLLKGETGYNSKHTLMPAVDVHRSVLKHEIVIESDYLCDSCIALKQAKKPTVKGCSECYAKNYEATRLIGAIIENKGFIPHYYYSGSKSIHMHIFVDFDFLNNLYVLLEQQIITRFNTEKRFIDKFMEWLRELMIKCWKLETREFDDAFIKSNHLIRAELSRNKKGFKTFLGYSHKDLTFIPQVCNEENRIYPRLGKIKLSVPNNPSELIEEFLYDMDNKARKNKIVRRENTLNNWMTLDKDEKLRPCVNFILSDRFKDADDGLKRGIFIVINEVKRVFKESEARTIINKWNTKMGANMSANEIEYRLKRENYTLTCSYIHKFLESLGFHDYNCNGKIYK